MRASILLLALVIASACTQKMICPAYQSSFIYDKEELRKKFSYFKEDSTPKAMYTASKNQYLVAAPESYRKKNARLQTVEMRPVFPVIPDSIRLNKGSDDLMTDADVVDSSAVSTDSVYAITKTKEKYNVDQDIYMWYFRDQLVLPDVRAAMETQSKNRAEKSRTPQKKKGLKGLFSRKKKTDSLAIDDSTIPSDSTAAPPKKKGILGIFGGKKKADKTTKAVKKDPAKKEDENDGF